MSTKSKVKEPLFQVRINRSIARKAKVLAARLGVPMRQMLHVLLEEGLKHIK